MITFWQFQWEKQVKGWDGIMETALPSPKRYTINQAIGKVKSSIRFYTPDLNWLVDASRFQHNALQEFSYKYIELSQAFRNYQFPATENLQLQLPAAEVPWPGLLLDRQHLEQHALVSRYVGSCHGSFMRGRTTISWSYNIHNHCSHWDLQAARLLVCCYYSILRAFEF